MVLYSSYGTAVIIIIAKPSIDIDAWLRERFKLIFNNTILLWSDDLSFKYKCRYTIHKSAHLIPLALSKQASVTCLSYWIYKAINIEHERGVRAPWAKLYWVWAHGSHIVANVLACILGEIGALVIAYYVWYCALRAKTHHPPPVVKKWSLPKCCFT